MSGRKRPGRRVIKIEDDGDVKDVFQISNSSGEEHVGPSSASTGSHTRGRQGAKSPKASVEVDEQVDENDELVSQFCSITSADVEDARKMLQIADNDVELAIQLYLEQGHHEPLQISPINTAQKESEMQISNSDEDIPWQTPFNASPWSVSTRHMEPFRDLVRESIVLGEGESAGASERSRRLADLFRPPFELMYRGTMDEARNLANIQKRWIMVDIQNPTEFPCQALNRDIWSDNTIKGVVKDSFVFIQWFHDAPNGARYLTYYPIEKYPHVAILDPRTGERVKVFTPNKDSKLVEPQEFLQEVFDFLDAHSLEEGSKHSTTTQSNISSPVGHVLEAKENVEPSESDKTGTRVQFRLPDGSRAVRRFLKSDTISSLFSYVLYICPELKGDQFDLLFMQLSLKEKMQSTLEECGISNVVLTVSCNLTKD